MDFNLSDTQTLLLESADRHMRENSGVETWRARRSLRDGFDAARWAQYADLGWLGLSVPKDCGGLDCPFEDAVLLHIALGRGLDVSPIVSTTVLGASLLRSAKRDERAAALLAAVATGDVRLALADAEHNERSASDVLRLTQALPDGDGYRLSGRKTLVVDAPAATTLLVTATIPDTVGAAVFAIDAGTAGLSLAPYPLVDGSHAADLHLDGVAVSADAMLITPIDGTAALEAAYDHSAIALMAQGVGAMEACLTVCADYLKERRQFGQPIGKFQALQHLMADLFVSAHQARSMVYQALAHADAEAPIRAQAVSAARIIVGEAMQSVSRGGIQLHGGYGITDEYAPSHYFRRMMALEKLYGDTGWHLARLASLTRLGH